MNFKSATYTRLAPRCRGSAGKHIPLTHLCFVLTVLLVLSLLASVFAAVMMIMIPVGNVWALTEVYLQHVLLLPLTSPHLPPLLFVSHPLIFSSSHVSSASQRAHFDVSCCWNVEENDAHAGKRRESRLLWSLSWLSPVPCWPSPV